MSESRPPALPSPQEGEPTTDQSTKVFHSGIVSLYSGIIPERVTGDAPQRCEKLAVVDGQPVAEHCDAPDWTRAALRTGGFG